MTERVKITGLWRRTNQDGTEYWAGGLGLATVQVWHNGYKGKDQDPDLIMYALPKAKKQDGQGGGQG